MTNKKYDTLVFIARLQPIHNAHVEIIRRALALTKELIIIIGSADQPRTYKNPFTYVERKLMLNNVLDQIGTGTTRVHIAPNIDTIYNDTAWMSRVQSIVSTNRLLTGKIGIIGHKKDNSTFYLNMFPQWEVEEVESLDALHATDVRDLYFRKDANLNFIRSVIPQPTMRWLEGWKDTPDFNQIIKEREFIDNYKRMWSGSPYPVNFVCVDACVVKSGHILMIKRRAEPGKGLLAMPGGYVNVNEKLVDAMIRELREETRLKVPEPVLKGSIVKQQMFDHPDRSSRGRVLTMVYYIDLGNGPLEKVKGGDDAATAGWVPISELTPDLCFEDHREIISELTGI